MRTQPHLRTNVLRGPLAGRLSGATTAGPEAVYDVLADLRTHLEWGGREIEGSARLLSLKAPAGPAVVGTEFDSTGEDPMVRMTDRSVVTEATRPVAFEFVTDSAWEVKRSGKRADLTIVHRYELTRIDLGCRVTYSFRATRASALPGLLVLFRIPGLRALGIRMSMSTLREGFQNLLQTAERRSGDPLARPRTWSASNDGPGATGRPEMSAPRKEEETMTKGYINLPGEGEAYWAVGAKGTIKGPNVYELENPPGWEVPLHVHDNDDEVHYYLEGEVLVTCGDEEFKGEPGSLMVLPRGVPHALKFGEAGPGRWLWISPQNRDDLFREAGVPASQPEPTEEEVERDLERIIGVFEQHGMRFLETDGH